MTLWSRAKLGLSRLCKISTLAVRYVLARRTGGHRNQDADAYLLRPRCCRTERYF